MKGITIAEECRLIQSVGGKKRWSAGRVHTVDREVLIISDVNSAQTRTVMMEMSGEPKGYQRQSRSKNGGPLTLMNGDQ